jgi:hypothetical protein
MNVVFSRRGFVLAGSAAVLAGCATTAQPVLLPAAPGETWAELEPVAILESGPDALTIGVRSRGCAAKSDFVFRVDRRAGRAVVAFARRRLETCKGPVGQASLRFGYDELGLTAGEAVVIANPVTPSA